MKTQALFKSIFVTAFIALLLPMVSCDSGGSSALVGRWIGVSSDDKDVVMELLKDGTGVATKGSKGIAITWKTEDGRFYLTANGSAQATSYKLQGSVLTFTEDNGKISEYTKCNKDCNESVKEYFMAKMKSKKGSFTDSRDGKSYKTLKFDKQTWMAENLNYEAEGSKCYDNNAANCAKYGRHYNWETAMKACPGGWHLPSDDEWQVLVDLAGGNKAAGKNLKASSGWAYDGNGIDAAGFAALPGGHGSSDFNRYFDGSGFWWSASELGYGANSRIMFEDNDGVVYNRYDYGNKNDLYSVRCLQD